MRIVKLSSSPSTLTMPRRLALPLSQGQFCAHFGRADEFFLCDIEQGSRELGRTRTVVKGAKPGECESVPQWLQSMSVTTVLVGGIGAIAQERMHALGINVVAGLSGIDPINIIVEWLRTGQHGVNSCDPHAHRTRHCREKRRR